MSAPRTKRQYQPSSSQPTITSHFRRALPTQEIQANLLSVGMRVRKSVPEGYKTHKTLPTLGSVPFTSSAPAVMQSKERAGRTLVRTASGGYGRELTPFCGLHKVGGWGVQDDDDEEEEEDVPGLCGSQGTLFSSQGSFRGLDVKETGGNVRKRGYEEEVEEQMDAFFAEEMTETREERPIARMKSGRKVGGGGGVVRIVNEDDFEEASFLAPVEGMEVDG
ncbi:unnamed protein product [Zymoseptoria tritici ST99CH_1E4]|uniref:Uncharacterized protein n=1 Tax=Zymoseptoria tritici ST99CH_1E4 TaxID=1276532 RepID=A0A2H1FZH9_ZYMTR|nr:unnamed protein product [Zymoseptoria tritici ST99CH_1E4]